MCESLMHGCTWNVELNVKKLAVVILLLSCSLYPAPAYEVWEVGRGGGGERGEGILFSACPWFRHAVIPWVRHIKFVSAQYFENALIELSQILHIQWRWRDLDWDCYASIFANLKHIYGPWLSWDFVSAQVLVNEWTKFAQILHMHWP